MTITPIEVVPVYEAADPASLQNLLNVLLPASPFVITDVEASSGPDVSRTCPRTPGKRLKAACRGLAQAGFLAVAAGVAVATYLSVCPKTS